jgi:RNA polymerase sigma-54 factor
MAVGQRLSLRQSQALALTPGLRQSIELMQLSAGDLAQLVQRKLEENPFLERDEGGGRAGTLADDPRDRPAEEFLAEPAESWAGDGAWGETLAVAPGPTLAGHLEQQIRLSFAGGELAVALALLHELDEAGYLPAEVALPGRPAPALVEQVIARLQALGPPGLFARSLRECLGLQLAERGLLDPAFQAILANLPLVAAGRRQRLQALTGLGEGELFRRLQLLRGLDPKPALAYGPAEGAPAIVDLVVTLDAAGRPAVRLNAEALPRLRVNLERRRALKGGLRQGSDKAYVAARTAEAGWLVRALARRGQSLLALGRELATRQAAFFTQGFPALRPLTRQALAEALGLSESSVSRLVANKYLASPQGVLPLARFFSAALGPGGASAGAAAARLARLVAEEPPEAPLSDRDLARRLLAEGFPVARRTVAKYRAGLKIPAAAHRRRRARMGAGTRRPGRLDAPG